MNVAAGNSMHTQPGSRHFRRVAGLVALTGIALTTALGGMAVAGASTPTEHRPSTETYVRRADKVCGAAEQKIDRIVEAVGFSPSDAQARRAVRRVVRVSRTELTDLRALTVPKGDAKQVDKVYDAVDVALDRIAQKPSRLFDEPRPFARATRLAEAYGLDECGRG